ncbi:DNA (cytosine-5-)-methyltransferase [Qipengyuania sp. S6317L1]|uniref:DNA (cytosine-5-)-methyltransferase n=1 Tax=Qipengyuania sp. S6317L1 TaxID=2926410 RepID=UPI001FF4F17F|nr:DNA (cytosine-5-)-methyltransferase [Qipengyuania sp. S6317L1]MCK0098511.1 DNA (cytosine-5-)-methyltransferase [Qipengyuania sp. S6317L1]
MELSSLVRIKRENLGLSQKEFSELLGLKQGGERTIRGWELGEHVPSPARKAQIETLPDIAPFKHEGEGEFKFIDLFAGIGGTRLGFQQENGKCVFTSEWDKFSKKTYAANFGELPNGDITQITAGSIPDHDVLVAGFPCQAFSNAGLKQGFYDTRGTMFFEIQRILAEKRPAAFLLENVKQLRGHDEGRTLQTILDILNGNTDATVPHNIPMSEEARASLSIPLDYETGFAVLSAKDFGVPQKRERIYLVGFSRSLFPSLCMKDFFADLPGRVTSQPLGSVLEDNRLVPANYTISDRLLQGHERRRIEHARKGNGFGYSVFNAESPYCNTISARYYKDGSEILIDQSDVGRNPRKLTPRECARIQGFPEEFVVDAVSASQAYRQFGNSVSVPVIRSIAKRMKEWAGGSLAVRAPVV